jgi:hypothetical protein
VVCEGRSCWTKAMSAQSAVAWSGLLRMLLPGAHIPLGCMGLDVGQPRPSTVHAFNHLANCQHELRACCASPPPPATHTFPCVPCHSNSFAMTAGPAFPGTPTPPPPSPPHTQHWIPPPPPRPTAHPYSAALPAPSPPSTHPHTHTTLPHRMQSKAAMAAAVAAPQHHTLALS